MIRWLRRILWVLVALVAIPLVLVLAVLGWAQTPVGQRQLADLIGTLASGPDFGLRVGGIEGAVPFDMTVTDVEVSDREGVWLRIDRAALDWRARALLSGEARIAALTVGRVQVDRLPVPSAAPTETEPSSGPPQLPVALRLDRLTAEEIDLAASVAGEPVRVTVNGEAWLGHDPSEGMRVRLGVRRIDERPGEIGFAIAYRPEERRLSVEVTADEPAGGAVGRLAGLAEPAPLHFQLQGDGPLDNWQARLEAGIGEAASAHAEASIRGDGAGTYTMSLDADARFAALLAPRPLPAQPVPPGAAAPAPGAPAPQAPASTAPAGNPAAADTPVGGAVPAEGETPADGAPPAEDSAPTPLGPDLRPLVEGGVTLTIRASLTPDNRITISTLRLAAPAATASLDGTLDRANQRFDLRYRLEAGASRVFAALLPDASWSALALSGEVAGPMAGPSVSARLDAAGFAFGATRVGQLHTELRAVPSGDFAAANTTVALDGSGSAAGLVLGNPALDPLLSPTVTWQIGADVAKSGHGILRRFVLDLPAVHLTAEGSLRDGAQVALARVRVTVPDLAALAGLAHRPLSGAATLDADARYDAAMGTVATVLGSLENPRLGIPQLDAVLGARTRIAAQVGAAPAPPDAGGGTMLAINGLVVEAEHALILADMRMAPGEIGSNWVLTVPDLSAADPAMAGRVEAEGHITGTPTAPRGRITAALDGVVVSGNRIPAATLRAELDSATPPAGRIELAATINDLPARVATRLAPVEGGGIRAEEIAVRLGSFGLTGAVTVGAGGTAEGRLTGGTSNLAELSGLAGQPLAGSLALTVDLAAPGGQQGVEATVEANGLAAGTAGRIGHLALNASVANALSPTPEIDARLNAAAVSAGGTSLDRVEVTAAGTPEALAVTLGVAGGQASANARATIARAGETTRINLASLQARYRDQPVTLAQPATVVIDPSGIAVSRLVLAGQQGRLSADGRFGDGRIDITVALADLPLGLARLADPTLGLAGTLSGNARVTGSPSAPEATFDLRADRVRVEAATRLGLPGVNATAQGALRGGRLNARATVTAAERGSITANADIPLAMGGGSGGGAPMRVEVNGRIDLAMANNLLAAQGRQVDGQLQLALAVTGSLAQPTGSGTVSLTGGRYRDAVLGTELDNIDLSLTGTGQSLTLTRLSAHTPGGGTIGGSGTIGLDAAAGFPADIRITAANATLAGTDTLTAATDADLRLSGAVMGISQLGGSIAIRSAEIRIPDRLPPSAPTIEVTEINLPNSRAASAGPAGTAAAPRRPATPRQIAPTPAATTPAAFNPALDITVIARQQVYVRGRGLNAELGGNLHVVGTAAAPRIEGALTLRQGTFDLLGNRLDFDHGTITFLGGNTIDPILDFQASTRVADITASVNIAGRPAAPEISFSSDPPRPQDEVVSYLLFGKGVGQLTALEAVRLAQSVAELTGVGGGNGLLDQVREATGLDRLDVSGGSDGSGPTLNAGRYVAEGVFVGVQQGVDATSSRVTVQVEVTDHVRVEADVGANASSRVGVNLEWDY